MRAEHDGRDHRHGGAGQVLGARLADRGGEPIDRDHRKHRERDQMQRIERQSRAGVRRPAIASLGRRKYHSLTSRMPSKNAIDRKNKAKKARPSSAGGSMRRTYCNQREPLVADGVDQIDQEQRRGGVFAQHRRRQRERCPAVVAQKQQEPQQCGRDHHDVVVALGDRLRHAEWNPSEQRDREAALADGLVAVNAVDQDERPDPRRGDQRP